ncbi:hypothetical protein N1031_16990 [Herbiconiux moechotypicola]|uniref:Uncharacterized protein n=1 Tax=Herbiconiux moechotypicola TaxID=637393 RepID=A0ABP5QL96_9MICO|nr:hypothetical protein [Herbiconiux moechotypicola]MCS5731459.1 hypothetical protein [Herbiconiux moechotypicola]
MHTTPWTQAALKARLRADIALGTVARPMTAEAAARRLQFHRIVSGIDAGRITPDTGAALLEELHAAA